LKKLGGREVRRGRSKSTQLRQAGTIRMSSNQLPVCRKAKGTREGRKRPRRFVGSKVVRRVDDPTQRAPDSGIGHGTKRVKGGTNKGVP